MAALWNHYREIWCADFEYHAPTGERPRPLCLVARELHTGRLVRWWLEGEPVPCLFVPSPDVLFVAYNASAELGCFLALDWPMPLRILDLYVEFRCRTSGLQVPCGHGLLGALAYFGLDGLAATEKDEFRAMAIRGGPYTEAERQGLVDYCQTDVDALARLLPAMLPDIDLPRALLRGRYMAAAARMEWSGVPIDAAGVSRLLAQWEHLKGKLIQEVNKDYGVFAPTGQKTPDPETKLGAVIIEESRRWQIDPCQLATAVDAIWEGERQFLADQFKARQSARRLTGLSPKVMQEWEASGRDYTTYPGLDCIARERAGELPDLDQGQGSRDTGVDNTDHAGNLWELLSEPDQKPPPKSDPRILRRAAEFVHASRNDLADYHGSLSFSAQRWGEYLARNNIPWPRLPTGALALDEETFREMAKIYPAQVGPMREALRIHRGELKKIDLSVGSDGRNRYLLWAFGSRTSRNQPSNSKSIFGPSTWLRSLIRPGPGRAIAYCDWSAQELAIAAALSGDKVMQNAYLSGDPYFYLARKAGAVPREATKKSHPTERDLFKIVSLGVLYGLSAEGLARKLNVPTCRGRELLRMHQETFRRFWRWSDAIEMQAMFTSRLQTVFGWRVHVPPGLDPKTGKSLVNPRSLRNFPMQAHGAEMMRIACCLATEEGIQVCAPVHDALLIEAAIDEIEATVERTCRIMREAGEVVLEGFQLRTDAKIVRYPDLYRDERGGAFWDTAWRLVEDLESSPTKGMGKGF